MDMVLRQRLQNPVVGPVRAARFRKDQTLLCRPAKVVLTALLPVAPLPPKVVVVVVLQRALHHLVERMQEDRPLRRRPSHRGIKNDGQR